MTKITAIRAPATMPIIMAVFSASSELIRSRILLFFSMKKIVIKTMINLIFSLH